MAHYDPKRPTVIAADASNTGIGAVLLQAQGDDSQQPVCFIPHSLSNKEKNYAVIEKETLAATWACEMFSDYMLGLNFTVETDHKPLVHLLSTAELHKMPPRIQCFRLHLMRYNPRVVHVTGKNQIIADQAPVSDPDSADVDLINNTTAFPNKPLRFCQPLPTGCRRSKKHRKQTFSIKSENTAYKAGQSTCPRTAFSSNAG